MKKLCVLTSLLLALAACNQPAANRGAANVNRPVEIKTAPGPSEADITAKEKEIWAAVEKKNYEGFGSMLDSDYVEVTGEGVYDKAGALNAVKDVTLSDVTFADWKFLPIDKDAVIISYTAGYKGAFKGKTFPPGSVRASSAWINRGGRWLAVYHQETEVKPAMPPPPPPKSTPSTGPAGSPANASSGPDATVNERLVWDALKSRNYGVFAAFLAPEFTEVEADGVYDRAGSIKGVSQIDFAKAELTEWKEVKFNDTASLVTYLVRIPGAKPEHERHSTIWANRGGKWLGLFHHGTPLSAPPAAPATKPVK